MKLRNDKEINALFASAQQGVQLSQLHQPSKQCIFSHRFRIKQIVRVRGTGKMPVPPTEWLRQEFRSLLLFTFLLFYF